MFGRPTPTKQTRWPASSRAAATIIISDFEKVATSVIGTSRSRPSPTARCPRPERGDPLGAELLDVRRPAVEVVDPLAQPGLDRVLVAGDRVPVEVEPVVAVVGALDVRRVGAERLDDDGVDDEPRDDRPVRVGADDRLVDQLLDDDDHPVGGEGRLLLAAEQAPDLGVAAGDRRAGRGRSSRPG